MALRYFCKTTVAIGKTSQKSQYILSILLT